MIPALDLQHKKDPLGGGGVLPMNPFWEGFMAMSTASQTQQTGTMYKS